MGNKIGVELRIDVTKIDKARLYKGAKGTYLTMTAFIDPDNEGQYGDHGMIAHKKDEGEERAPIIGNAKVFWRDNQGQGGQPQPQRPPQAQQQYQPKQYDQGQQVPMPAPAMDNFDDDIPFN